MINKKGYFISFEGCEGTGKTTQALLLTNHINNNTNHRAVYMREPGGTNVGEQIREILLDPNNKNIEDETELILYGAARVELVNKHIIPNLEKGNIVICDRFKDSTIAYQGYGRGLDIEMINKLQDIVTMGLEPDLTVLLDLPPAKGLKRKFSNNQQTMDRIESEKINFHRRVRKGYRSLYVHNNRMKLVSGAKSIEEIENIVREIVINKINS